MSGYEEPQVVRNTTTGVPVGGHTEWTCPAKGNWQLDCYGAQGASTPNHRNADGTGDAYPAKAAGGKGAHIAGRVELPRGKILYVNVGEQGRNVYTGATRSTTQVPHDYYELDGFAWNGGGNVVWGGFVMMDCNGGTPPYNTDATSAQSGTGSHAQPRNRVQDVISGGGGATDISLSWAEYTPHAKMKINQSGFNARFFDWKSKEHLYSRVIVAGGGGGGIYYQAEGGYGNGGDGGAWIGENGKWYDVGEGGQMERPGYGGAYRYGWKMNSPLNSTTSWNNGTTRHHHIRYYDGPYAGGYSCSDGMFGEGGNYTQTRQGCGAGGGGWYGGGSGGEDASNGSGAGGSSFLWSTIKVRKSSTSGNNAEVTMASLYDTIESDWNAYQSYRSSEGGNFTAETTNFATEFGAYSTFEPYMPTTSSTHSTRKNHNNVIPYMTLVTADQGANPGDGWATIQLVQIDEDQE